ncbi:MAG: glycerol-3-phosphate acyltransferase [Anaerolineales bacterium]|nr:glycerol-3-phosphate acyltransferase [Anaerolineales bacterium]NUQ85071.1 glycerol-3-phosphate acyltransferase [Anaerolineales bacterium]
MQTLVEAGIVALGYILGSIPFGLLIVKFKTGKDIREIESGRTGGTNAMRAAGFGAGLLTAILDILKGAASVWLAQVLTGHHIIHVLAPVAAILGHNYSVFLISRDEDGKLRFHGGAGGAPALGGSVGLWGWSLPILFVLGALIYFTVGIASITTIAVGIFVIIIFSIRASMGLMPWVDVLYGVLAELLLLWALRPNIRKLLVGNERVVKYSLHGWLRARKEQRQNPE